MTKEPELIQHWITIIQEEGRNLSKWEESFIESIAEQFSTRKSISDRQEEILERIYMEKTP